jgi:hypothetical protein
MSKQCMLDKVKNISVLLFAGGQGKKGPCANNLTPFAADTAQA